MGAAAEELLKRLQDNIDAEVHAGPWLVMDQERIDLFAGATGDKQWIHTDPERARLESPYGTTVAHGFLTLSLLPFLTQSNQPEYFEKNYPGMRFRVNYGLNRVRFPAPVKPGSRIRARSTIKAAEMVGQWVQITYLITVEIEGGDKPACIAEQVVRVA